MKKLVLSVVIGTVLIFSNMFTDPSFSKETTNSNIINTMATVHVTGAVNKPGMYKVPVGMRLVDILSKAGGLKKDAFISDLNLTDVISDGTSIHIATKKEVEKITQTTKVDTPNSGNVRPVKSGNGNFKVKSKNQKSKSNHKKVSSNLLVNLNTANIEQLSTLPGVGEKLAESIINYRSKKGKFKAINELMNIERVGNKKFNKMKNKVTV